MYILPLRGLLVSYIYDKLKLLQTALSMLRAIKSLLPTIRG